MAPPPADEVVTPWPGPPSQPPRRGVSVALPATAPTLPPAAEPSSLLADPPLPPGAPNPPPPPPPNAAPVDKPAPPAHKRSLYLPGPGCDPWPDAANTPVSSTLPLLTTASALFPVMVTSCAV